MSLLAAGGSVYVVFHMLRRQHLGWAYLSVLMLFFSNYFQAHATEARGYSLLILLSLITTHLLLRYLVQKRSFPWIGYSIFSLMMLYTHFFGWWVLFTHLLLLMCCKKMLVIEWKKVVWTAALILIGYAPYGKIFIERAFLNAGQGTWVSPVTNMGSLHDFILWCANGVPTFYAGINLLLLGAVELALKRAKVDRLYYWPIRGALIFFAFFAFSIYLPMPYFWEFTDQWIWFFLYSATLIAALWYLFFSSRFSVWEKWMIGMWTIPLLAIFLVSTKVPMYLDRYVSFCVPFFYITMSGVLLLIGRKKVGIWMTMFVSFLWLTSHQVPPEKREVRKLVNEIKVEMGNNPSACLVICPYYFDLNVLYYWNIQLFKEWGTANFTETAVQEALMEQGVFAVRDSTSLQRCIEDRTYGRYVYLDASADFSIPGNGVKQWLEQQCEKERELEIPERFVLRTFTARIP